jgi:Fe-S-cluster-containing dehydrogenase component
MGCKVGNHLADDDFRIEVLTHGSGKGIDRPEGVYPNLHMWWQPVWKNTCTWCANRIAEGELPFCVMDCPTFALACGDDSDAESAYSQAKTRADSRGAKFFELEEKDHKEGITYASTRVASV